MRDVLVIMDYFDISFVSPRMKRSLEGKRDCSVDLHHGVDNSHAVSLNIRALSTAGEGRSGRSSKVAVRSSSVLSVELEGIKLILAKII